MDDPKIVTRPARVDFHIHSAASVRTRDAGNEALARCTPDRVETLVEKMNDPRLSINMCAITDHDCFDVEMYRALKSKEGHGALKKVLPGVEFTVALPDDGAFWCEPELCFAAVRRHERETRFLRWNRPLVTPATEFAPA